ncbi:MAG: DeoR/GlpR family DNA-binding transcription regulator [Erysipelotrichaceae bacterium]|jgi:DeoR family fructose operon transcriptional repressor
MYQEERQKLILDYVMQKGKVSTKELSEMFETSVVTIRSDLSLLAQNNLLVKTHGGAIINSYRVNDIIPSDVKFQKNVEEKKKVALIAKRYLRNGDVVIIDSGSTTLELAKIIDNEDLTVFTNDLQVGIELAKKPNVKMNISGGELIKSVYTLAGYETVEYFSKLTVDKLFLSCDALDLTFGISNRDKREIPIKKAMINASRERILMLDHTKLDSRVLEQVAELDAVDCVIVDKIDNQLAIKIEEMGIEVISE